MPWLPDDVEEGMRLLMIGFGNVGRTLGEILWLKRQAHPRLAALDLTVVGLFTRRHGALASRDGIDMVRALREVSGAGGFSAGNPDLSGLDPLEAVGSLDYDALVELSVTDVERRGEPAISFIRGALSRGKHAVTANKGPAAFAYRELSALARERGCAFRFESTVMDGAPLFSMARESLRGCVVSDLSGIVNSTTNYVLDRMEAGESPEAAVARAQKEGFAEADPSKDLEGWDAAAKIALLANVLMDASLTPFDVRRTGITGITADEVRDAARRGRKIKLLAHAWREGERVLARVAPEEIPAEHPFASTVLGGSIVRIETDLMGPILVMQENPTLYDTAYGVINDLMTLPAP